MCIFLFIFWVRRQAQKDVCHIVITEYKTSHEIMGERLHSQVFASGNNGHREPMREGISVNCPCRLTGSQW